MKTLVMFLVVFASLPAFARKGLHATQFQVGGIRSIPENNPSSAFVHFSWTPMYKIRQAAVRGEIGATRFLNINNERFWSLNYGVYAYHILFSLVALEAGAGLQTWMYTGGGTHPLLSANLVLAVEGSVIERLVLGYSRYLFPGNEANQYYSGIAFNI